MSLPANPDHNEALIPAEDPFALFDAWLDAAIAAEPNDPTAMTLATATPDGRPAARMVLLKGVDGGGFVFYTNLESRKGRELAANPHAALCFHWKSLRRQVRAEGPVEPVSTAEADAYFASRPLGSRIGAWASAQSRPLPGRAVLEAATEAAAARFGEAVPRPPHWGGFRLVPLQIEFWRDRPYRLHERLVYARHTPADPWTTGWLYP